MKILAEVAVGDLVVNQFAGRYRATPAASATSASTSTSSARPGTSRSLGGRVGRSTPTRRYVGLRAVRIVEKGGSRSRILIGPGVTAVIHNVVFEPEISRNTGRPQAASVAAGDDAVPHRMALAATLPIHDRDLGRVAARAMRCGTAS